MNASVIVTGDGGALSRTVRSTLLASRKRDLVEVLVPGDRDSCDGVVKAVKMPPGTPRHIARNAMAAAAVGDLLVFVDGAAKPADGWLSALLEAFSAEPEAVFGPTLTGLDEGVWSAAGGARLKYRWDWDLRLRPAYDDGGDWAMAVSADCMAVGKTRFSDIGGFDEGPGEELEFCLKNWLCGGAVRPVRRSAVAVRGSSYERSDRVAARAAEVWLGKHTSKFYEHASVPRADCGRLDRLTRIQKKMQVRDVDWLLERYQPELSSVQALRGVRSGASVAILCDGPSFDAVDRIAVARHDLVIGTDYVALAYDCDYVVSLHSEPIRSILLSGKYPQDRLVLPSVLLGPDGSGVCMARDLVPSSVVFALAEPGAGSASLRPPFLNYGHPLIPAVQLAAWMGAASVTLYGWDGRLVLGRSHTSMVPAYGDGRYWVESEHTLGRYDYYERGVAALRKLLAESGITFTRFCYA